MMRGCDGPTSPVALFVLDGEEIKECPGRLVKNDPDVADFLSVYSAVKSLGSLPMAGGILDQTNLFVEAAKIVEAEVQATMDEEARKVKGA